MNTQRISATLTTQDRDAVLTAIDTIREKLPFLIDLGAGQRKSMAKLVDRSQAFVRKAFEVGSQNPGMLPVSFDLEEMRRDADLFDSLSAIRLALDKLGNQVADRTLQAGAEAFAAARAVYAATKTPFAGAALRTAADDLGRRFGRRRRVAAVTSPEASPAPDDSGES